MQRQTGRFCWRFFMHETAGAQRQVRNQAAAHTLSPFCGLYQRPMPSSAGLVLLSVPLQQRTGTSAASGQPSSAPLLAAPTMKGEILLGSRDAECALLITGHWCEPVLGSLNFPACDSGCGRRSLVGLTAAAHLTCQQLP